MLRLGMLRNNPKLDQFNTRITQASPLLLSTFLAVAGLQKYLTLVRYDGGNDLLGADIPKALMVLQGQNPYLAEPWAAPYPPLHLLLTASLIQLTDTLNPYATLATFSQNIRTIALLGDLAVGAIIFFILKLQGHTGLQLILPTGLYLLLPSISLSSYYYYHSDMFAYPILALSLLALTTRHYLIGTTLLATATIYKIHPILAIPLLLIWLIKTQGLTKTLPSILSATSILALGLVLPLTIPGYQNAMLGFNLSTGYGNGTSSFTILNLFYTLLPTTTGLNLPITNINWIWITITTTLYTTTLTIVWSRAKTFQAIDIILLGLLAWLLPLRQLYTHYVIWAIIPFLTRGNLKQTITIMLLLELAHTMTIWSWNVQPNSFPLMSTVYGFFTTSLAFLALNSLALLFVLKRNGSGTAH